MLELRALRRSFPLAGGRAHVAVDGLTLSVPAGEVYGLLGPNGAGKTTTLRVIATLLRPDSGTIEVDGVDAVRSPVAARARLAFVPAEAGLPGRLTGREVVSLFAGIQGVRDPEARAAETLEQLGASAYADRPCGELSTGMKRRVVLARALVHDPAVLLLDEPTDGLDVQGRREVLELIRRLAGERRALILSSHILAEVERVCERVGILSQGRLVSEGTLAEWAAWALMGTPGALVACLGGLISGVHGPGGWLIGVPCAAAVGAALGLGLGAGASDEVAGATRAIRVLPVAAAVTAGLAWWAAGVHPALGALVPLGGALLVAGDVMGGPVVALCVVGGSVAGTAVLLAWTARSLRHADSLAGRAGALGLVLTAALAWWVGAAGPAIWGVAGNRALSESLDPNTGPAAAAVLLLLVGLASRAVDRVPRPAGPSALGVVAGALGGLLLAAWSTIDLPVVGGIFAQSLAPIMGAAAVGRGWSLLLAVPALELVFRGELHRKLGGPAAAAAWAVVAFPFHPLAGIVSGAVLGGLRWRFGLWAAIVAHLGWAAARWGARG